MSFSHRDARHVTSQLLEAAKKATTSKSTD